MRAGFLFGLVVAGAACGGASKRNLEATAGAGGSTAGAPNSSGAGGAQPAGGEAPQGAGGEAPQEGGTGGAEPGESCTPRTLKCEGNDIVECETNDAWRKLDSCSAGYYCTLVPPGVPTCLPRACQPGFMVCVGNVIKTCTDDGKLSEQGVDCGADACVGAACAPKICEPGTLSCREEAPDLIYECLSPGATIRIRETCAFGQRCVSVAGVAACYVDVCHPGTRRCFDNAVGVCRDDAQGLGSIESDCASLGQVCNSALECQDEALDVIGADDGMLEGHLYDPPAAIFLGNSLEVTSSRTLTRIEEYFELDKPGTLHWYVMKEELPGSVQIVHKTATAYESGKRFFDSGPISYELTRGTRYSIGAAFLESGEAFIDSRAVRSPPISFANVLGRVSGLVSEDDSTNVGSADGGAVRMRLTTEAP